jgi:hypothetical protein
MSRTSRSQPVRASESLPGPGTQDDESLIDYLRRSTMP